MYVLKLFLSETLSEILFFAKKVLNFYTNGSVQPKVSSWNMEFARIRTEFSVA